jgi:hypothetical protein
MIFYIINNNISYLNKKIFLFNSSFSLKNKIDFCDKVSDDIFKINSNDKKKNRFSNEYKKNCKLTVEQEESLIDIILGDGCLERQKFTHNTRLRLEQAYPKNEKYLLSLFNLFKSLTISQPKVITRKPDKRTNKIYKSIAFKMSAMFCLNKYHELFYKNGVKFVPDNIHELLTARGLAY